MEPKEQYVNTLISGLENMLSTGNHADVTIVVDGKVFPCHKVSIFRFYHARYLQFSPVFIKSARRISLIYVSICTQRLNTVADPERFQVVRSSPSPRPLF